MLSAGGGAIGRADPAASTVQLRAQGGIGVHFRADGEEIRPIHAQRGDGGDAVALELAQVAHHVVARVVAVAVLQSLGVAHMRVVADQRRQQRLAGVIDAARAGGGSGQGRADMHDAGAIDQHRGDAVIALAIEDARVLQQDRLGGGRQGDGGKQ